MANGDDIPVTWGEFRRHEDEAKHGYERISTLEAEVMGDEKTKRPSLRVELTNMVQTQGEKTRNTIRAVGIPLLVAFIAAVVMALTGFHIKP